MNQYSYNSGGDIRTGSSQSQQGLSFHPSSYQNSTYTNSATAPFHSNNAGFISTSSVPQLRTTQVRLTSEPDDKRMSIMDNYFLDQSGPSTSSSWQSQPHQNLQQSNSALNSVQLPPQISYQSGTLVTGNVKSMSAKLVAALSPDKVEKERVKKQRQAEAARMRYHRLNPEEKRELNLKRTLAQKRKRQREKEMEELESILRETNDIQEDPDITEQLREKRMRAKWAEAARSRYARMTPEERRSHNNRRRMRQMQNALAAVKASGMTGDPQKDEDAVRQHIKGQNARKAEAARLRYHRMTDEEKRVYNQRRTEAFRRRRMEEEMLLAMPIGRINGEALDRAQQIVVRNAKRAEAARLRYQRMTPDQRKAYNQKRYTPKKRRSEGSQSPTSSGLSLNAKKEEMDALSSLERDVMKRTQQAQQALLRQRQATGGAPPQNGSSPAPSGATQYVVSSTQPQVVHTVHPQMSVQSIAPQGHVINQSQGSSGHVVVHHQPPTSGGNLHTQLQQVQQSQQMPYSSGVMISGQHVTQPLINPYGAPHSRA